MIELKSTPSYCHRHAIKPLKTRLTIETAGDVYRRLRPFLALPIRPLDPAAGWDKNEDENSRSLFQENGFHHPVRWTPRLKRGWRRLTYIEFCNFYGIN